MNEPGPPDDPPEPRRIGGAMIVTAWVVVIALVSVLFADLLTHRDNPNREVRTSTSEHGNPEVTLERNHQGHYVASGHINGAPVVFLLDTGATEVSVPAGLAERIGLPEGRPARAQTANGVITTYRTRLDSVGLGGIELHDVRAHINPAMSGDHVLLGMSFLGSLDIRQRAGTLTLTLPQSG